MPKAKPKTGYNPNQNKKKLYRLKRKVWAIRGQVPLYAPFPLYSPSFWARAALLESLLKPVNAELINRTIQEYWPRRVSGLHNLVELITTLEYFSRTEEANAERPWHAFLHFVKEKLHSWTVLPNLEALLPLLDHLAQHIHRPHVAKLWPTLRERELWIILWLLPALCKALEYPERPAEPPDKKVLLENLHFLAYVIPRTMVPTYEVEPESEPKAVSTGRPVGVSHKKLTAKPIKSQYMLNPPYSPKAGKHIEHLAQYLTGKSLKRLTNELHQVFSGEVNFSGAYRNIRNNILELARIVEGGMDPLPPKELPKSSLVSGLTPEEEGLLRWAKGKPGGFTLMDILRSGPKKLRTKDKAIQAIYRLVCAGKLAFQGDRLFLR